ncbi:kinase-like protein [Panus rudis PR-1116 ss-1]|nr:kinase-like protein [Panus rudis PR-1116 ss-1]
MSLPWTKRKRRLQELLGDGGSPLDRSEDALSLAMDRILHGQSVIGKTSKTTQVDSLRFSDKDLSVVGTLEYGQFGVIDVVNCKIDGRVYVRKSTEKHFALRTHDQCSPQNERDILLRALKTDTRWSPHLLCAYQTPTHLNLVMDYAEGGTLLDVLESSPLDGRVAEEDIHWWAPQLISAIHWCHSQGYVHRDIKPNNFILTSTSHVMLIDFGSAAPLLPSKPDGSQQVAKIHCQVPCGTCDYISPEILQTHEEALVALEMSDVPGISPFEDDTSGGYGRETDWWSFGAMLYEMAYGVTPFFASDIRQTYAKIMDHQRSLRFNRNIDISSALKDLLRRLLTTAELRLGRCDIDEIQSHPFFEGTNWLKLHDKSKPANLHLPQFTYSTPIDQQVTPGAVHSTMEESHSKGFAFSALFDSSPVASVNTPGPHVTPSQGSSRSILRDQTTASFIGFSWGPTIEAFEHKGEKLPTVKTPRLFTPRPFTGTSSTVSPFPALPGIHNVHATPGSQKFPFATPVRANLFTPYGTLPRASTVRRTAPRRTVSDREAMKQLVDCVGMSARKKVLESGRKPRILNKFNSVSRSSTLKELRFDKSIMVVNDTGVSYRVDQGSTSATASTSGMTSFARSGQDTSSSVSVRSLAEMTQFMPGGSDSSMESDVPPSPSPSPRPGSAMSTFSLRSQTPTTSTFPRIGNSRSVDSKGLLSPALPMDPQWSLPPPPPPPAKEDVPLRTRDLSMEVLNEFQRRHSNLMNDIGSLEGRLEQVAGRLRRKV